MLFNHRVVALILFVGLLQAEAGFWSNSDRRKATEIDEVIAPGEDGPKVEYGVDVSFPIHYATVSTNYDWLPHNQNPNIPTPRQYEGMPVQPLGDRQKFYQDFLQSCKDHFGTSKGMRCTHNELDRIAMSLRQPQSMQNYTDIGFKSKWNSAIGLSQIAFHGTTTSKHHKQPLTTWVPWNEYTEIRAPDHVWKLIKEFWEKNKDKQTPENWGVGNTYTNNWESPSFMVSVEDQNLRGGGRILKKAIWDAARDTIQEWTGQELTECSLYGIRVYTEGAILATHVDRLPLVSSAIINVAQDGEFYVDLWPVFSTKDIHLTWPFDVVDEPWPLEVYGHDGKAVNVTMEPGDMVLVSPFVHFMLWSFSRGSQHFFLCVVRVA